MLLYYTDNFGVYKVPYRYSPDETKFVIHNVSTKQNVTLKGEVGKLFYKQIVAQAERLISDDAFDEMVDAICSKYFSTIH